MRRTSDPLRRATLLLMAGCALLPSLLALVAVGLGAAAPTTQGLTQATGALSAAAFQGLDRRALDLAPLMTCPGVAYEAFARRSACDAARACASAPDAALGLQLPLRL